MSESQQLLRDTAPLQLIEGQFAVAKKLSHNISSSSEMTGSPVQRILLPMTASHLSCLLEDACK